MKALVCTHGELAVADRPEADPGPGQVRLQVLRCGICGSDLHARHSMDQSADMASKAGYDRFARSNEAIVMGHEFCGEVAEYGTKTRKTIKPGTPVVALPLLKNPHGVDTTGLSVHAPGAYAEQVLVEESLMMAVPNGLLTETATLTEPLAVAWHAVRRGDVNKKTVAIVIGCGPVGLGVILMLKAKGVQTVVASDFSPARRALAKACGADIVIDPREHDPYTAAPKTKFFERGDAVLDLVVNVQEKLVRIPGWWNAWKLAEVLGQKPAHPVIFECVGVPGVIQDIIDGAPGFSRVVVVGVCMAVDKITPFIAINKEIDLRFCLGYTPPEFHDTLQMLAEGKVRPEPLITATVGLAGVDAAFTALGDPEVHAKILVDPSSEATLPAARA
jgi:threonine dehydrogenase-like Zn-dependent dehydrogenase